MQKITEYLSITDPIPSIYYTQEQRQLIYVCASEVAIMTLCSLYTLYVKKVWIMLPVVYGMYLRYAILHQNLLELQSNTPVLQQNQQQANIRKNIIDIEKPMVLKKEASQFFDIFETQLVWMAYYYLSLLVCNALLMVSDRIIRVKILVESVVTVSHLRIGFYLLRELIRLLYLVLDTFKQHRVYYDDCQIISRPETDDKLLATREFMLPPMGTFAQKNRDWDAQPLLNSPTLVEESGVGSPYIYEPEPDASFLHNIYSHSDPNAHAISGDLRFVPNRRFRPYQHQVANDYIEPYMERRVSEPEESLLHKLLSSYTQNLPCALSSSAESIVSLIPPESSNQPTYMAGPEKKTDLSSFASNACSDSGIDITMMVSGSEASLFSDSVSSDIQCSSSLSHSNAKKDFTP